MTVGLIWAHAAGGVIGDHGTLPWHLPEDLQRFKRLTMGATVVMGRVTWESLPVPVRPLPGRRNVVLSRQPGWRADGAVTASSLADALAAGDSPPHDEQLVWVIGGAGVFAAALPLSGRLEVTEVDGTFPGDTFAPAIGAQWSMRAREPASGWLESRTGLRYRNLSYVRSEQACE